MAMPVRSIVCDDGLEPQHPAVPGTLLPALLAALKQTGRSSRGELCQVLGGMGPEAKEAIPLLIAHLKNPRSPRPRLRDCCARSRSALATSIRWRPRWSGS